MEEAVHGLGAVEVFAEGIDDAVLGGGEFEGEEGANSPIDGVVHSEGNGGAAVALMKALDGDGGLMQKKFVVREGALRGDGFFQGERVVDFSERFLTGEIVAVLEVIGGEPFGDLREERVEHAGDDFCEHVRREFDRGGIHRFDLRGLGGEVVVLVEDFELRLDDLQTVAEGGDFSGGAQDHSGLDFFVETEGVEPGEDAAAAFGFSVGTVAGGIFEERFEAAGLSGDEAGLQNGAADGGHVAGLDGGDGSFVGVVEVVARQVEEEVAAGSEVEGGEFCGADLADVFGIEDGGGEGEVGHFAGKSFVVVWRKF